MTLVPIEWSSSQCSQQCLNDPQFLRYDSGKTYVYRLETQTLITSLDHQTEQSVSQQSLVELSALSPCELSLQVRETRFEGLDPQYGQQLSQELDAQPLIFGYDDGLVTDVCAQQSDQLWSQDVKKAVISSLQMSAKSLTQTTTVVESDVLGECETTYDVIQQKYTQKVIRKQKQLNRCENQSN